MTTTERSDAPVDNLVRALIAPDAVGLRAGVDGESDGRTLFGHFAVFNRWTEIDSMWEGRFLERIADGAFERTFTERRDQIKVLYDHGHDPQLGNKPLGPISELKSDKVGAYYEVELIRTPYNDEFIIPAADAGLLGASFRFKVTREEWVEPKSATKSNPAKLPERTIEDLDLYEFGPVTFPAYSDATAGVRSMTDDYVHRLLHEPLFLARYIARAGTAGVEAVEQIVTQLPSTTQPDETPPPSERHEPPAELQETTAPPDTSASTYTPTPRPRRSLESLCRDRQEIEARLVSAFKRGPDDDRH